MNSKQRASVKALEYWEQELVKTDLDAGDWNTTLLDRFKTLNPSKS